MKIEAVGFDIDGTLYPDYKMYIRTSASFLLHPCLMYYFGKMRKKIRRISYDLDFQTQQAKMLAGYMNISEIKAAELMRKNLYDRWEPLFRGIKPYPEVKNVLHTLKREGFRLGALSDFPVGRKLEYMGLDSLMDFSFSSEETGYLKPHPVPFRQIVRKFGIPAEKVLYVGNNYSYDIVGASEAELKTAYLTKKKGTFRHANFVFHSYYDLRDWLRNPSGVNIN